MTAMTSQLKTGAFAFALICAGVLALCQRQEVQRLSAECAVLRGQVADAASQREEIQRMAAELKVTAESWEADRAKLMRLRAQSSRLNQAERENVQLKSEQQRLAALLAQGKSTPAIYDQLNPPPSAPKAPSAQQAVTDLGVVEVSDQTPVRLDLGDGKECVLTTTVLNDGQLQMDFAFESMTDGVPTQTKQTATVVPGTQIAQIVGGVEITLTPTLKGK